MAWRMKVVDNVWLTLDDGHSHTAVRIDDIVSLGTSAGHKGSSSVSGDFTKEVGFKLNMRSGAAVFFPCHDAKYARYCARRISRITYA